MPDKQAKNRNDKGQFKAGTSGNPKGRPEKDKCIADLLRCTGEELRGCGKTRLQNMITKLWDEAERGNLKAMEMIFDRLEGKPIQATITSTEELTDGFITKRIR